MKIEAKFQLKCNDMSWSNQEYQTEMSDGAKIFIIIDKTECKLEIIHNDIDKAKELLFAIWELLAWYDGYFYKLVEYVVDGEDNKVDTLFDLDMYSSDFKLILSSILIGRNKRCFSEDIILNYSRISKADRKNKSMNREMFNSYFHLKSAAYKDINIEHKLVLLMHVCDGFAIQFLKGNTKNNSGNIGIIVKQLNVRKYKHGVQMLGISSNKALNALGYTRNELSHFVYSKDSLGSNINNPNYTTDAMVHLYVFCVLDIALRVSLLQTIGFRVNDEIKEYLLDVILDWIRLEKHINEDCVIPINNIMKLLKKMQNQDDVSGD